MATTFTSILLHTVFSTKNRVHLIVKKESSKWVKRQGRRYRDFYWQEGYGAFSIGQSNVAALKTYIANQMQHHRKMTFEEESVKLLKKYNIAYDESYVFG